MPGPSVRGLHSILLDVRDRERALWFYRDLLGLEVLDEGARTILRLGESMLVIQDASDVEFHGTGPDPGGHSITFLVDDPAAWTNRLKEAGLAVSGPFDEPWGTASYTRDPDGRSVGLLQPARH